MRKDAFNLTLTAFVLGIFGFFLRWLQNMNAFEVDTGLAIAGAKTSVVFLAFSVAAALLLVLADRLYLARRVEFPREGTEALRCSTVFHKAVLWLLAAVLAVCSLVMMFSADGARFPTLLRLCSGLGILAAAALPFAFPGPKTGESAALCGTASIIPILFCCVWLVTDYIGHAENPVLWQYVVEMLAVIAVTMSFYYVGAYHYKRSNPFRCLLASQLAAYLCICTMADSHAAAEKILFAAMAGAMLVLQFIVIENGKAKE